MPLTLTQTVAPTIEPLLLSEVKNYLRLDGTENDAVVEALALAAREEVEIFTGLTLLATTFAWRLWGFGACPLQVPRPPLQSVTSITYFDSSNVSQTLSSSVYTVDTQSRPGRILLTDGQSWPSVFSRYDAVTITYVAGHSLAALPERAKIAMKLMIGDYYENREAQLETRVYCNETVKRLLWGLRLLDFV